MWHTKQLILHGGIILLVGLLSGAPFGRAIVHGKSEAIVRAWRVAHSGPTSQTPFSHPRTLIGNFTTAQALLKTMVSEVIKGSFVLKTDILVHPLERIDGALTQIEERALYELAKGCRASRVMVWVGSTLNDAEVIEKMKND